MKLERDPFISGRLSEMREVSLHTSSLGVGRSYLRLDSNENLQLPEALMKDILRNAADQSDPRLYPDGKVNQLRDSLSAVLRVSSEGIVVDSGGDALIQLISGPLMKPDDRAVIVEPTFSMYGRLLRVYRRDVVGVHLNPDFSLDVEAVREPLKGTNEVVFLCSPNNPTGNQFEREEVRAILESTEGLVALDEAYADFAPETLVELTSDYENLFVLRTFSKAFGLAGLRVGYAVTNRNLAGVLQEHLVLPYPVSSVSLNAAILMLSRMDVVNQALVETRTARNMLSRGLASLSCVTVYPSVTNFVLLQTQNSASSVAQKLGSLGIRVRVVDWISAEREFIRITAPPIETVPWVLDCLREVLVQ